MILARILNKRGVEQPAVMIGDKDMDVCAGKACGIDTIGVSYGYAAQGELEAAQPTMVIPSIEQLCQYLLQE